MDITPYFTSRPPFICWVAGLLLGVVYGLGLIIPLFDHDSAHHALIGMHMFLTGDYVSLIDRGKDYLDKPHLLFWLSALGDSVLGVGTLAYKLPSLILAVPGVYATYRLGKRLFSNLVGRNAALILTTSYAYILAQNDVRMDALLLSFIITATWMLYEFSLTKGTLWLVGGSLALALAFSTKGLSGVFVPVLAVGSQILYSRNWTFLRSFRWLWVVVLFFVFSSPVLYSYYLQYDLHPEKVIRGTRGHSGLAFILFYQNIERMEGTNWGSASGNDPFFFFHTLLWALLPWGLLAYWAVTKKALNLWQLRLKFVAGGEIMTFVTIVVMFTLLSISNFKLPHYLNILFPFFALLIAAQLQVVTLPIEQRWLLLAQKFVAVAMVIASLIGSLYLFPIRNGIVAVLALVALFLMVREWIAASPWLDKLMGISVAVGIFANLLMNGNFYPQVQHYLGGLQVAAKVKELNIPPQDIRLYDWESNTLNYYTAHYYKSVWASQLKGSGEIWLAGPEDSIAQALDSAKVQAGASYSFAHFRTTRLNSRFLNPATRQAACKRIVLVQLSPPASGGSSLLAE
jgi:4-amino-4-deoxy-L-arabinose transferase-like glycosyltransferase